MTATKWAAAALYVLPGLYGGALLLLGCSVGAPRPHGVSSAVFVSFCLTLGTLCCITSAVGLLGVLCLNEPAIRATVVLVVLENVIAFLLAVFLGGHLIKASSQQRIADGPHTLAATSPHAHLRPQLLHQQLYHQQQQQQGEGDEAVVLALLHSPPWHETAAILVCVCMLVGTIFTSCCVGTLSEFQSLLDAELLAGESEGLKDLEQEQQRQQTSLLLLPPSLYSRSALVGSSLEAEIPPPLVSFSAEGFTAAGSSSIVL